MPLLEGGCSGRMRKIHILSVKPSEELRFSAFASGRRALLVLVLAQCNTLVKQFGKLDWLSGEVPSDTLFLFLWKIDFIWAAFKEKKKKRVGGEAQECLEWDGGTRVGRAQGLIGDKRDSCWKGCPKFHCSAPVLPRFSWEYLSRGVFSWYDQNTFGCYFLKTYVMWLIQKGPNMRSWGTFVFGAAQNKYEGQFEEITFWELQAERMQFWELAKWATVFLLMISDQIYN